MRQLQVMQQYATLPQAGGECYEVPTPNKYSPEGNKSPSEFLFQCEQYFEACGVPENKQVPIASTLLEDGAVAWWRQHKTSWPVLTVVERIQWWPQFKQALHKQFTPVTEKQVARERLYCLKQLDSVQTYTALFRQLTFDIDDLGEADKLHLYIHGLQGAIKVQLALREPNTLEEAMATAERVDVALNRVEGSFDSSQHQGGGTGTNRSPLSTPDPWDAREGEGAIPDRCRTIPDRSRAISDPYGGISDHFRGVLEREEKDAGLLEMAALFKQKTVPMMTPKQGFTPSDADVLLALDIKSSDRPLEFGGRIAGRNVRFLLDTGAGANFLAARVAETLGDILVPQVEEQSNKAQLPDGTQLRCSVSKPLPICLGHHRECMTFNVVPLQEFDVILGQPWLHQQHALLSVHTGRVLLRPPHRKMVVLTATNVERSVTLVRKDRKPHQPTPTPVQIAPQPTNQDSWAPLSAMQFKKAVRKGEECFVTFLQPTSPGDPILFPSESTPGKSIQDRYGAIPDRKQGSWVHGGDHRLPMQPGVAKGDHRSSQLPGVAIKLDLPKDLPADMGKVLNEFWDVFPKSLPPGLPPKRGVDHRIELEPGAPPPSRPTYHLSHKELGGVRHPAEGVSGQWVDPTKPESLWGPHPFCEEKGWHHEDVY